MRPNKADITADTAVGDVSGEMILVAVFSRVTDEEERAILFAHVALDIPLSRLERQFGTGRHGLDDRIEGILAGLRQDTELLALLGDIRRAGRSEHYQAIIVSLGLQDWFCTYCGQFMAQRRTGRPRKTCSDTCRRAVQQANRLGLSGRTYFLYRLCLDTNSFTEHEHNWAIGACLLTEGTCPISVDNRRSRGSRKARPSANAHPSQPSRLPGMLLMARWSRGCAQP